MTPEQEAAIAHVRHRLERMAHFGVFTPDRSKEKSLRADRRADRAMLFLSAEGGINSAPWMRGQLEADCAELLREAKTDRVSFDAARVVASVLRREKVTAPDCIQEFETLFISGEIVPPNKNGNYLDDQRRIDAQINQCVSELCNAGFTKSIGNAKSVFFVISQLLKDYGVSMKEETVRTSYRRARKSGAENNPRIDKAIADYEASRGNS